MWSWSDKCRLRVHHTNSGVTKRNTEHKKWTVLTHKGNLNTIITKQWRKSNRYFVTESLPCDCVSVNGKWNEWADDETDSRQRKKSVMMRATTKIKTKRSGKKMRSIRTCGRINFECVCMRVSCSHGERFLIRLRTGVSNLFVQLSNKLLRATCWCYYNLDRK